jgi:hypothetical protein
METKAYNANLYRNVSDALAFLTLAAFTAFILLLA